MCGMGEPLYRVETIESDGAAFASYTQFREWAERELFRSLMLPPSMMMTTDVGPSYASARVHEQVRAEMMRGTRR